ncbi:MAG: AI-2E family transporter [Synergistaceae bacterium]|jgi:predicted PurR-regulated permease PerM|nr:AI-2E family transporter [Synergistaceae bacterium]
MEKHIRKPSVSETCLVLLTIFAVGFILSRAERVAIPLMLAFILTLLLYPVVKVGQPHKIPPVIMIIAILICFFAVFVPLGVFLNARLQSTLASMPVYHGKLVGIGRSLLQAYQVPPAFWESINWYNTIGRYLSGMPGFLLNWLSNLVMVMVFLIFMLLEAPYMDNRLRSAFKGENGDTITRVSESIVSQISKYLRTLAVISLMTGAFVWGALSAIKVDFAPTWALLAFVLNFIPTVGSIVASIPPILVALVQYYPDPVPALLTLLALLTIQFTIGNILTPKIMGDALDLSPVVILVSLMFWGGIWGVAGALLSVPIAVMIKIICENVQTFHFLAVLMSSAKEKADEKADA